MIKGWTINSNVYNNSRYKQKQNKKPQKHKQNPIKYRCADKGFSIKWGGGGTVMFVFLVAEEEQRGRTRIEVTVQNKVFSSIQRTRIVTSGCSCSVWPREAAERAQLNGRI